MRWSIVHVVSVLALTTGLTRASHFSRDESSENDKTEFNLVSTYKGDITNNRHHARAHLDSQLYPDLKQQTGGTSAIDAASGHERGGSGMEAVNLRSGVFNMPQPQFVGFPQYPTVAGGQPQQVAPSIPSCGLSSPGAYPNAASGGCQKPTIPQELPSRQPQQINPNPLAAIHSAGNAPGVYPSYGVPQPVYVPGQPVYPYPGTYLQQYPGYPQPASFPVYPNYPGSVPVVTHPGAPSTGAYSGQQGSPSSPSREMPRHRDHNNRSFSMKTEYTEDGVHKGAFDVLNNHGNQGYGSGFGGGYNGAFNRQGY